MDDKVLLVRNYHGQKSRREVFEAAFEPLCDLRQTIKNCSNHFLLHVLIGSLKELAARIGQEAAAGFNNALCSMLGPRRRASAVRQTQDLNPGPRDIRRAVLAWFATALMSAPTYLVVV